MDANIAGRRWVRFLLLCVLAVFGAYSAFAASCATQSQMTSTQRDALANMARAIATQMQNGDVQSLKANAIPEVAADFSGIAASVENLKPLLQNATLTVNNVFFLDASTQPSGAQRTDFYCGQPVVSINFVNLPTGTYALTILHATGVSQPQQISLILSKTTGDKWMLAGLFSKPMILVGHDGLWYWTSARKFAQANMNWDAWLYYRLANDLLNPLDILSSPNLEKLQAESEKVKPANLPGPSPMSVTSHGQTYAVTGIGTTTTFGTLDLDLHYTPDSTQVPQLRDPPTARKQVVDLMSALLVEHPELQQAFHGIWVHADQGAVSLFALDLPMDGISNGAPHSQQPAAR
jgi:hypothetical protein